MKIPDWLGYAALKAILWLNPLAHVAGLAIAVWAWRATRKAGYIVVVAYFLLAAFNRTLPAIIRVVSGRPPAQAALTPQQKQEYARELVALDKRYFPLGHPVVRTILFPLGPIVLVTGLWMVAKRDAKRQAAQATPVAGAPSDQPVC